jgi:hypothetical protein
LSFYMFAGVALLSLAATSQAARPKPGAMFLSGVMFAAAAWTRPEGLILSWLLIGVALLAAYFTCRAWTGWRPLLWLISPLLAYSAFWLWLKSEIYSRPLGRSGLAGAAAGQILSRNLHLPEALYILRALPAGLLEIDSWGWLGMLTLLVLLAMVIAVGLRRLRRTSDQAELARPATIPATMVLALCGVAYILAIAGMYYLASYDTAHDISWWLSTGLERMLLPGLLLAWVGGVAWTQVIVPVLAEPPPPQ